MIEFEDLDGDTVDQAVWYLGRELREVLEKYGLFVAGGYVRDMLGQGTPVCKDIDVFGPTDEIREAALAYIAKIGAVQEISGEPLEPPPFGTQHSWFETPNMISVRSRNRYTSEERRVEFLLRWPDETPDAVISRFDFRCCAAVIFPVTTVEEGAARLELDRGDETGWAGRCVRDFTDDLVHKRLVYMQPERDELAAGTLWRMLRFVSRGWTVDADNLAKILARFIRRTTGEDGTEEQIWYADLLPQLEAVPIARDYEVRGVGEMDEAA